MTFILWVSGILFDPRLNLDCTCGSDTDRVCFLEPRVRGGTQLRLVQRDAQNVLATGQVYVYCASRK